MRYKANFQVDCGVSHGFGMVFDDVVYPTREFEAENDFDAIIEAQKIMDEYAQTMLAATDEFTTAYCRGITEGESRDLEIEFTLRENMKEAGQDRLEDIMAMMMPKGVLTKKVWVWDKYRQIQKEKQTS